jgi:hypothetical protein
MYRRLLDISAGSPRGSSKRQGPLAAVGIDQDLQPVDVVVAVGGTVAEGFDACEVLQPVPALRNGLSMRK